MYEEIADSELLLLSREEPDAFGALYERHAEGLLGYFARRTFDAEVAAELTAETWAAARLAGDKKYLASTVELNTVALSHLRYIPSVAGGENAIKLAAPEMKAAKMLSPDTDIAALTKRAFAHLDGVSDEWVKGLQVEKVAGGQVPPNEDIRLYAELIQPDTEDSCCKKAQVAATK